MIKDTDLINLLCPSNMVVEHVLLCFVVNAQNTNFMLLVFTIIAKLC